MKVRSCRYRPLDGEGGRTYRIDFDPNCNKNICTPFYLEKREKKQIWWHNSYKLECNRRSMTCTIVTGIHYGNEFLLASWRSITNVTMLESIFSSKNKMQTWETKTGDSLEQQSARQWSWGTRGWKPMTSHWWLITINDGIFLYTLQRHTTQVQH